MRLMSEAGMKMISAANKAYFRYVLIFLSSLFILGCSLFNKKDSKAVTVNENYVVFDPNTQYEISTSVKQKSSAHFLQLVHPKNSNFNLENTSKPSAYSIILENCASGYTSSATSTNPKLIVVKDDKGCLGKLYNFTFNNLVYTQKTGLGFNKYTVGELATFSAKDANNIEHILFVQVVTQLSSGTQSTDTVTYQFYEGSSSIASSKNSGSNSSQNTSQLDGSGSFQFNLISTLLSNTTSNGEGNFRFVLECDKPITDEGSPANTACEGTLFSSIDYVIIRDDNTSAVWDLTTTKAMFDSGGNPYTINPGTDIIAINGPNPIKSGTLANGGFVSSILTIQNLNLYTDARLILRSKDGSGNGIYFINFKIHFDYSAPNQISPPDDFSLTSAIAGDGQVTLTWPTVSGASSYTVSYATSSNGTYTPVSGSIASPQVVSGLTNGTTYYFKVSAVNAGGSTDASIVSATPFAPMPSCTQTGDLIITMDSDVTDFNATGCDVLVGNIRVNNSSATGLSLIYLKTVTGYIYINQNANLTTITFPQLISVSSYIDIYRNAALTSINFPLLETVGGEFDSWINSVVQSINIPKLTTIGYYFETWQDTLLTTVNAPLLETVGSDIWVGLDTHLPSLSFPSLQTAGNSNNSSFQFIQLSAITSISAPNLTRVDYFDFEDNPLLQNLIFPALRNVTSDFYVTGNASLSTCSIYDLIINNPLIIVGSTTVNTNGSSGCTSAPYAFNATVTPGYKNITVDWTNPGMSADSFTVKYGTQTGNYTSIIPNLTGTSYVISGLDENVTYYVMVVAVNTNGSTNANSELSTIPNITTSPTLSSVVGLPNLQFSINWTPAPSAQSHTLSYGTQSGVYTVTVPSITNQPYVVTIDSADRNNTFYFQVSANFDNGSTTTSVEKSANLPLPGTFTFSAIPSYVVDNAAFLSWSIATGADSYTIDYGTQPGIYTNQVTNLTSNNYRISGLSNGTTYYFMVTAVSVNGNTMSSTGEQSVTAATGQGLSPKLTSAFLPSSGQTIPGGNMAQYPSEGIYAVNGASSGVNGQTQNGIWDSLIIKYDTSGNTLWTRQLGVASTFTRAFSVAADASGVYVSGHTNATLPGETKVGNFDVFLAKYNHAGDLLWNRQFSTAASGAGAVDYPFGIALDGLGGVFIGGFDFSYNKVFLTKYDTSGNAVWIQVFQVPGSLSNHPNWGGGLVANSSGVYFTAVDTSPPYNSYLLKYDNNTGSQTNYISIPILGAANGSIPYITADDSGNIYLAGSLIKIDQNTGPIGSLWVAKYDSNLNLIWNKTIPNFTTPFAITVNTTASITGIYIAGTVQTNLNRQSQFPIGDGFILALDLNGNQVWDLQFGSNTVALGLSTDSTGSVYLKGDSAYPLGDLILQGGMFVFKFDPSL